LPYDCVELTAAQCLDQVAAKRNLITIGMGEPLLYQRIDPPLERGANVTAKART
jgi:hypothetical protein